MPRLINPYAGDDNPIAGAISGLADSMFGDVAKKELIRQKALGLIRENQNIPLVAGALERGDSEAATRYGVMSGMKGPDVAAYHLFRTANRAGVPITDAANSKAYLGAGHSAAGSPWGVGVAEGNKRAIAQMTTDRAIAADDRRHANTFEKVMEEGPDGAPRAVLRPRSYLATRALGDNPPTAFDPTVAAADRAAAADMRKFDNTFHPVYSETGEPELVRQSELNRRSPVLDLSKERGGILRRDVPFLTPGQRAAAGEYEPKQTIPRQYVTLDGASGTTLDNETDAQTKAVLPPGVQIKELKGETPGTTGNSTADNRLVVSRTARANTQAGIKTIIASLEQPNAAASLGWIGSSAILFSGLRSQVESVVRTAGGETVDKAFDPKSPNTAEVDKYVKSVFNGPMAAKLLANGVSAAVLRSQIMDLTYVLAKQQNESGSIGKADVAQAIATTGGSLVDPKLMAAVLRDLDRRSEVQQQNYEAVVRSVYPAAKTLPAPGAPPPSDLRQKYGLE